MGVISTKPNIFLLLWPIIGLFYFQLPSSFKIIFYLETVWPVKNSQMSIKLPKSDFTRKIKAFDTFTEIAKECGRFGQNNCCHGLWKVTQSPINHPISSHCNEARPIIAYLPTMRFHGPTLFYVYVFLQNFGRQHYINWNPSCCPTWRSMQQRFKNQNLGLILLRDVKRKIMLH